MKDRLSRLLNEALYHPWNMNTSRIFFDVTKETSAPDSATSSIPETSSNTTSTASNIQEKKGGARKGTRKIRQAFMKTRRLYL